MPTPDPTHGAANVVRLHPLRPAPRPEADLPTFLAQACGRVKMAVRHMVHQGRVTVTHRPGGAA
ncbi:hypothetical protein SAMN05421774_11228 [Gemmobacter megaterium]|uniref:Uncharacterized protein n=1 Tax=Gemmobacter megaterium TaxID=1086013 RepID=A0A1N7QI98_9RHOB|nr:hypothetical protein [Gemmobacter megaterium]GGE26782.1 hypothetical protein GCM10011345_35990 [Gemmobacter megaterium]SIT22610.1 hypothetical protein SAMN05421774_11228 [Gemmobacter megaterium]